jgi:glucose-6-phosphate 1-dehydrogenase
MIRTLLLLGASGDLARRFLLPALGSLLEAGRLPEGFRIVGAARGELGEEDLQSLAGDDIPAEMLAYRAVDLADHSTLAGALGETSDPVAAYLALPPALFPTAIGSLGERRLPAGSRIVVEKPFGEDLESARELNSLLAQTGLDVYRVDHVLGMETVQNLAALRRGNPVLDRVWNGEGVELVEILWEETLALEGRAGYYDHAGALKDVLQNHMLQLLALIGMEPLAEGESVHERKIDVFQSVRIATTSRRARYTAGTLADGRQVGPYAEEAGVDPARCTETFAEVALRVELPRWRGTRFVLRAGKALSDRRKLIRLHFRGGGEFEFGIDGPEDVVLRLTGGADTPIELRAPPRDRLPPYAHVVLDVLGGTSALSVSGEEAEQAWRIVAPVLASWEAGSVPLEEYPAGSAGPP